MSVSEVDLAYAWCNMSNLRPYGTETNLLETIVQQHQDQYKTGIRLMYDFGPEGLVSRYSERGQCVG